MFDEVWVSTDDLFGKTKENGDDDGGFECFTKDNEKDGDGEKIFRHYCATLGKGRGSGEEVAYVAYLNDQRKRLSGAFPQPCAQSDKKFL